MFRAIPILLALSAGSLYADVTVHYQSEMKSSMPGIVQATAQLNSVMPSGSTLRIKGNRSYLEFGPMRSLGDSSTKQVTLLDTEGKKYATTSTEQYLTAVKSAMPAMPPAAASILAAFKTTAETKATGRTATIQGVEAEEREVVLSVEGPAMPNMPPGPMMRVVMQIWMSKESEAERVPALRELAAYNQSAMATMNPLGGVQKILDMIPGLGDGMGSALKEMTKANSVMMRLHFDLFMPGMVAAMKQMPAGSNPFGADFDPNGPLMQMNQEVVELSTAELPDSQFQVPEQYQPETVDEFVKTYLARVAPAAK